jgi:hypothetical protein
MWQHWINAILGLWIMLSNFMGMSSDAMTTNLMVVGAVIAVLGFWGAYTANQESTNKHGGRLHV